MKTSIRIFVSLLVLASMLVSMPITALAMDDNPKDCVVDSIGVDDLMGVNKGTVTTNNGMINANHGNVETNNGTVEINGDGDGDGDGVGDSTGGTVSTNNGTILTNNYYIITNGEDGYIEANNCVVGDIYEYFNAAIKTEDDSELGDCNLETGNFGTITDNNGTVVFNGEGGIVVNNGVPMVDEEGNENCTPGLLILNKGTVVSNNSSMWYNFGTVETNNEYVGFNYGTVETNNHSMLDNNGTVEINDDGVLNNYGTIGDNNGYVLWNTGTVETNTINGIVSNGYTTNEDGSTTSGTIEANYGTVIGDDGAIYYGVEIESSQGGLETKLIQAVENTIVKLTDLFKREGYELVGYTQVYQQIEEIEETEPTPDDDPDSILDLPPIVRPVQVVDPITVNSSEYKAIHPNLLTLIWRRIPPYLGLSAGNSLWTNGLLLKVIAVEGDNYVLTTCDTFSEEELKDLSATLGKLLTPWQIGRLIGEPQVLSPEMTAEFFGDNGFHITFTLPQAAL